MTFPSPSLHVDYDLSPFGVVGNSGWNACFLNNLLGSDTTVAPNNGVWGAPKTPAGVAACPTVGWVNGTCYANGTAPGGTACTPWSISASVNYASTKTDSFGATVSTANGYFPGTPAPCWANTAPTSYNVSAVAYDVMDATSTTPVPHFLDFSSVLYKDVNGRVHRQQIPPGSCLPGNLINVRTSAISYTLPVPTVQPIYPLQRDIGYPTGANQIYSTTNDAVGGAGLSWYTPRSSQATPASSNGPAPATLNTIRVFFALNYGLRNALDNSCDGRTAPTTKACVNGGYYVSNLTTALLGDPSKGLGRATYAVIRLCHSPVSTTDRPWRKKSGDVVNNKQCMDAQQLLYGANTELVQNPTLGASGAPSATFALGSSIAVIRPLNALSGLAINDVPLTNYTDGNLGTPIIPAYVVNKTTTLNMNAPSPVAFCRPLSDPSFPSGVNPDSAKGVYFNAQNLCQQNQFTNNTLVDCPTNCVLSGSSWSVTKGTNVNLNDPAWYSVDIVLSPDTPRGNYFVRVLALDANYNYLGFGSSATSANLTNTASQNYFHITNWAVSSSSAVVGGLADIRAGAAGCSAMSLLVSTAFFIREVRAGRRRKAAAAASATAVMEDDGAPPPAGFALQTTAQI